MQYPAACAISAVQGSNQSQGQKSSRGDVKGTRLHDFNACLKLKSRELNRSDTANTTAQTPAAQTRRHAKANESPRTENNNTGEKVKCDIRIENNECKAQETGMVIIPPDMDVNQAQFTVFDLLTMLLNKNGEELVRILETHDIQIPLDDGETENSLLQKAIGALNELIAKTAAPDILEAVEANILKAEQPVQQQEIQAQPEKFGEILSENTELQTAIHEQTDKKPVNTEKQEKEPLPVLKTADEEENDEHNELVKPLPENATVQDVQSWLTLRERLVQYAEGIKETPQSEQKPIPELTVTNQGEKETAQKFTPFGFTLQTVITVPQPQTLEPVQVQMPVIEQALGKSLIDQLIQSAAFKQTETTSSLTLQLNPAFLGKLNVIVNATPDGMTAVIRAASDQTRMLLNTYVGELKKTLSDLGIDMKNIELQGPSQQHTLFQNNSSRQKEQAEEWESRRINARLSRINGLLAEKETQITQVPYYDAALLSFTGTHEGSIEYLA
jgi:flagellar hook-length control protein FliK